jgi:hypothetical protein
MIGWLGNALLGPLFRWFTYRAEVRLWMDELDAPIPFELVTSDE